MKRLCTRNVSTLTDTELIRRCHKQDVYTGGLTLYNVNTLCERNRLTIPRNSVELCNIQLLPSGNVDEAHCGGDSRLRGWREHSSSADCDFSSNKLLIVLDRFQSMVQSVLLHEN